MIRNLNLPDDASRYECAKARNEFTRNRIKDDFKAGLEEMEANSSSKSRDFSLPVFTVSSMDFQK